MSLRSRALLGGVARGFFKANNDRRARMEEQMTRLANDTAMREREQAKSEYDRHIKAANAESANIQALRSAGHIDDANMYTPKYWRDTTFDIWDKENYSSQEEFIKVYSQGMPDRVTRQYKDPNEISGQLHSIYNSIDQREREALSVSPLTSFDEMLGRGLGGAKENTGTVTPLESFDVIAKDVKPQIIPEEGKMFKTKDNSETKVTPFRNAIEAETGEVLGNVFTFEDGINTKNMQRQPDGTWKEVNVTSRPTTEEGEKTRMSTPKLNKVQEESLVRYDRHDRVQRLASELAKNEYKGNPADFVLRNLAVLKDVAGATVGMTGDHNADLEAITAYVNDKITAAGLEEQLGRLDTAAIIKGDIEATTKFLVYATANMFHEGDRITVAAKETAESVIDSLIFGTATHDARLMSLASKAQDEMSRVTMENISAAKEKMDHPLWDYYPNIKRLMEKREQTGVDVVTSVAQGSNMSTQIQKLAKSNPNAYQKTIKNLLKNVGTTDPDALMKPVFVHEKLGVPVVISYIKNNEGAYDFRLTPIK